jgi:protein-tyrosine phosphatase
VPRYIDLHTHILHSIDDGPRTLNEAVMLARGLVDAGYEAVVATPHACEGSPAPAIIKARVSELQAELNRQQIALKILPGSELHIEPHTAERLDAAEALTLNGSRYLLLELPFFQPLPLYLMSMLFTLKTKGYQTIIAHPERVSALQHDPQMLYTLHEAGVIYQVTWGALTGRLGPEPAKVAEQMLNANLVHLLATDAHNFATRLLELNKAAARLEELTSPGTADLYLITRPAAIINNEPLDLPAATPPTPSPTKTFATLISHLKTQK